MNYLKHSVAQGMLIFSLVFVFCISSFVLSAMGVDTYRKNVQALDNHFAYTTAFNYIAQKVRQNDGLQTIQLGTIQQQPALIFQNETENSLTYLYFYEGYIRELYIKQFTQPALQSGQKIIKVNGLTIEQKDGIFILTIVTKDKQALQLMLYPMAQQMEANHEA